MWYNKIPKAKPIPNMKGKVIIMTRTVTISKPIIINDRNADRITAILTEANGKAKERTIKDYAELKQCVAEIVTHLNRIGTISKKALTGTHITWDFGYNYPGSYTYRPESTQFCAIFDGKNWKLTWCGRDYSRTTVSKYGCNNFCYTLSATARDEILRMF